MESSVESSVGKGRGEGRGEGWGVVWRVAWRVVWEKGGKGREEWGGENCKNDRLSSSRERANYPSKIASGQPLLELTLGWEGKPSRL